MHQTCVCAKHGAMKANSYPYFLISSSPTVLGLGTRYRVSACQEIAKVANYAMHVQWVNSWSCPSLWTLRCHFWVYMEIVKSGLVSLKCTIPPR